MILSLEYDDHTTEAIDDVQRARFKDYKIYIQYKNGSKQILEVLDDEQGLLINQCFAGDRLLFNIYEFNIANNDEAFNKFIEEKMEKWRDGKCKQ
jgi:hypothetical protein